MDKTVLKNFAIESRKDLMEKIDKKIKLFYVEEEFKKENRGDVIVLSNDKHTLTLTKNDDFNRDRLIQRIVELGYNQVVEEAAYTWFNRIVAIRYMELHDFLPLTKEGLSLGIRVLSSIDDKPNPEILKFSNLTNPELDINLNRDYYSKLTSEDDKFKYILNLVCDKLGSIIPQVFNGITDYIDLLVPDNMLVENGFVNNLITQVPSPNFNEVEILGWFYQYYNQTEKDRAMSQKSNYRKEDIPYVTELFTPDWIVKYMVENSVGCLSDIESAKDYKSNEDKYEVNDLSSLKIIDPCSGSGHILVYIFSQLVHIYENMGYNIKDIPTLILKNNLYGLDIDDRAAQLTILSILLKAREYDKNIFSKNISKDLHIFSLQESGSISETFLMNLSKESIEIATYLINEFKNAKEIGSLLKLKKYNYKQLENEIENDNTIFGFDLKQKLIPIIKTAEILSNKYDFVITNPPYMTSGKMTAKLKEYVNSNYKEAKGDLYTCFINNSLVKDGGYLAMITQHTWMFLSAYEGLREYVLNNYELKNMIHLGPGAFEDIGGEVVQTTSFVMKKNNNISDSSYGKYFRLVDLRNAKEKELKYLELLKKPTQKLVFNKNQNLFKNISSSQFIYWLSPDYEKALLTSDNLGSIVDPRLGMATANNDRFMRLWHEVSYDNIKFDADSRNESIKSKMKWFPYNKGGEYRKWYGNNWYVVNWFNDGYEIRNFKDSSGKVRSHNYNLDYLFKKGITWTFLSTTKFSCRYFDKGFISDSGGSFLVTDDKYIYYVLGLMLSKFNSNVMKMINPTLSFQPGNIASIPLIFKEEYLEKINRIVKDNIKLEKEDWDLQEISWDFRKNGIIGKSSSIKEAVDMYINECCDRFNKVKKNEEELNHIYNDIYEITSDSDSVDDKDITVFVPTKNEIIKSLISYSVGCMFGRYSLNTDGIVCASTVYNKSNYNIYIPDDDNIIPISDNEDVYYNDDIVGKFKDFLRKAFGSELLNDNINYIAETLGKKGTESSEDTIRRYFINDFYSDHLKMYQKRPIYWLFDSGKKNGFKCLVYLHRYNEQIVSKIRTKYLHNTLSVYLRIVDEINYKLSNENLSTTDKREIQNKLSDLNMKITECNEYDEKVGNVANKMIKLDLDDGVVLNYSKFIDDNGKSILANIK